MDGSRTVDESHHVDCGFSAGRARGAARESVRSVRATR